MVDAAAIIVKRSHATIELSLRVSMGIQDRGAGFLVFVLTRLLRSTLVNAANRGGLSHAYQLEVTTARR